ncbi:MAG TPA: hypothetical protein VNW15_00950 [Rhizomicrobium sp.]|jgi:hypothetical protein|nr:hypothetical protein [Rhizomicrobium sp.]
MQQDHRALINVEAIRMQFRPRRITTLFVGESAPASGDFFYYGNSNMLRYMKKAVESVFGGSDDFLGTFKSYGWYLDDLVLTPVNQLNPKERRKRCWSAKTGLTARIAEYQPAAIVSLMVGIEKIVEAASLEVKSTASRFSVPFPGNGQQTRFHSKMIEILPDLPKL